MDCAAPPALRPRRIAGGSTAGALCDRSWYLDAAQAGMPVLPKTGIGIERNTGTACRAPTKSKLQLRWVRGTLGKLVTFLMLRGFERGSYLVA